MLRLSRAARERVTWEPTQSAGCHTSPAAPRQRGQRRGLVRGLQRALQGAGCFSREAGPGLAPVPSPPRPRTATVRPAR